MIPILCEGRLTDYNRTGSVNGGIGRLDQALSCVITEDLVGVYELELTYPADGRYARELKNGNTIAALRPYANGNAYTRWLEPFEIYKISIDNGIMTVNAHHLSYMFADSVIEPLPNVASNLSQAYQFLGWRTLGVNADGYWRIQSMPTVQGEFRIESIKSFREYLYDDVYSLKKIYNVDIWFREYDIYFGTRGEDRGAEIRPGKNLSDWSIKNDASEAYNAIVPYWQGQNDSGVDITVFANPKVIKPTPEITPTSARAIDFSSYFETAPTQSALTTTATNYLNTLQPWEPYKHIEVGFYHDTVDADLIDLGDTVTVYLDNLENHREKMRIVSVKYDSIMEKFIEIELGDPREGFAVTSSDGLQATRKNMA